jgi:hypothetical protein
MPSAIGDHHVELHEIDLETLTRARTIEKDNILRARAILEIGNHTNKAGWRVLRDDHPLSERSSVAGSNQGVLPIELDAVDPLAASGLDFGLHIDRSHEPPRLAGLEVGNRLDNPHTKSSRALVDDEEIAAQLFAGRSIGYNLDAARLGQWAQVENRRERSRPAHRLAFPVEVEIDSGDF